MLALVLSNVGEWEATSEWIEGQSDRDGRTAVQSALNELTRLGYRRVFHERLENGQIRTVAEWFHEPITRPAENPTVGETDRRNSGASIEDHLLEHYVLEDHKDLPSVAFESFWEEYPRKAGKGQARKAWEKAIRKADPVTIIDAAVAYREDPNRDAEFTAHPATWLNGERWSDDPLPSRSGGAGDRNRRELEGLVARAAERDARRAIDAPYGDGIGSGGNQVRAALGAGRTR